MDESQQGGAPVDSIDDWEADNLEKQKSNLSVLEAEVPDLWGRGGGLTVSGRPSSVEVQPTVYP